MRKFDPKVKWLPNEGGKWVFGSTELALKSARIVDFCRTSADFENIVVVYHLRIPDCACPDVRILAFLNEIGIIDLSSALVSILMSSFFFELSSFKLKCETFIGIVLCLSH